MSLCNSIRVSTAHNFSVLYTMLDFARIFRACKTEGRYIPLINVKSTLANIRWQYLPTFHPGILVSTGIYFIFFTKKGGWHNFPSLPDINSEADKIRVITPKHLSQAGAYNHYKCCCHPMLFLVRKQILKKDTLSSFPANPFSF